MSIRPMFLMMEDEPVVKISSGEGIYSVLNDKLLPFGLKGRLVSIDLRRDINQYTDIFEANQVVYRNYEIMLHWLGSRVLLLSRANAKKIYNACGIPQMDTDANKAMFSIKCRAVSLSDRYWVKYEDEEISWASIDIKNNSLNNILTEIALHGKGISLQGDIVSPECTTNGCYAKAWRRRDNGSLWLYKLGDRDSEYESRVEVMSSKLLDCMNVSHVHYEDAYDEDKYVCACPLMDDGNYGMLDGAGFISYCNAMGIDSNIEMYKIDADSLYKMSIVDFLISNSDRHIQNWGFYYDVHTMKILRCHPLFDHNNAFDKDCMKDFDFTYNFNGKSMRESAMYAMKRTDFYFTKEFKRTDFMNNEQYQSFMERAEMLGVKVKSTSGSNTAMSKLFNKAKR